MPKFLDSNPEQAYLLPPSVRDVFGPGHLFFCPASGGAAERGHLPGRVRRRRQPRLPAENADFGVVVCHALGVTSSRRLEQRIREDLAFRYLAGGATPDHWTLNAIRQRHATGLNDLFTRMVDLARASGLGRLGHVAIDSTRGWNSNWSGFGSGSSGCTNRACRSSRGPILTAVFSASGADSR